MLHTRWSAEGEGDMKVSALQSFGLICGGVLLSAGCAAMQATPDANRLAKMLEDCGGPQRGDAQQPEKLNPSETADAASTYLRIRSFEDVFVKNERVAYTINAMSWNVDLGEGGYVRLFPERRRRIETCLREKYRLPL